MAVLCGFMIGSLRRIWPFKEEILSGPLEAVDVKHKQFENVWPAALDTHVLLTVGLAVAAILFVFALDRVSQSAVRKSR
jgi:putative membrane protein